MNSVTPQAAWSPISEPARASRVSRIPNSDISTKGSLKFGLFIALTGCFFIRPTELLGLTGWNLFEYLIIGCCLLSLPSLLKQYSFAHLRACPITALLLCLAAILALSILIAPEPETALIVEFCKFLVYVALLLSVIDSVDRLRRFMTWLAVFIFCLGFLPVLQYHEFISLHGIDLLADTAWDASTAGAVHITRLVGAGTFNDPNDLCQILSVGVLLSLYSLRVCRSRLCRCCCVLMIAENLYAITLTQSRGGLIALFAGLALLLAQRFRGRTALLLFLSLLLCLSALNSRQTDLSTNSATAQTRVELWSSALVLFAEHPLLGVGAGNISGALGHVVHNSFIQAFAEMGFFGGTVFLGLFAVTIRRLLSKFGSSSNDPSLTRMRVFLLAALAAYVGGMLSLTHVYELTPYMFIGTALVFYRLTVPGWRQERWLGWNFCLSLLALGAVALVISHLFVRLTYHN